ncbi:MAG TPA: GEVED domain-containing protein [Flavobacteriales bacterium]|nr:GEVED domain-containing protein [Flavobacteriales bacterium]HRP81760.1 GEVED domain-containing protein [Flavobacteriales bacterium]
MNSFLLAWAGAASLVLMGYSAAAQGTYDVPLGHQLGEMPLFNGLTGEETDNAPGARDVDPPVNNWCTGATVYQLSPGQTVLMSGDNTGVVVTDPPGYKMVWEAFELTACANVTINYCVPGSVFTNHIKSLAVNCPDFLTAILLGYNTSCTATFPYLDPGTYWIPVYAAPGITPQGPYTIEVSATACTPPTAYCIPISATGPNDGDYISRVQLGAIDNSSLFQVNIAHVNYTAISTPLQAGQAHQLSVISGAYNTDQVAAWIDYNQDFDFTLDEKLGEGTAISTDSIVVFNFTVPEGTPLGSTRLRIRTASVQTGQPLPLIPCYNYSRCETEDYTVIITPGGEHPVNDDCAGATITPLGIGQGIELSGDNTGASLDNADHTFVWEAISLSECATVTIDYCVAGSVFSSFSQNLAVNCPNFATGMLAGTVAGCTVTFADLPAGTYWIPVEAGAGAPQGAYSIGLSAQEGCIVVPTYCIPTSDFGPDGGDYIGHVLLGDINNASTFEDGVAYVDYTAQTTVLIPGQGYQLAITGGDYGDEKIAAWIDYNGDLAFSAGEKLGSATTAVPNQTVTFAFAVPEEVAVASTRLRVRLAYPEDSEPGTIGPCFNYLSGETEDYTVVFNPTAIPGGQAEGWRVFPNPGRGKITLCHSGAAGQALVHLCDVAGRVLHSEQPYIGAGDAFTMDLEGRLAPGLYVLRVTTGQGRWEQRVVVQ